MTTLVFQKIESGISISISSISISKYNALNVSSYIQLPKELNHSRKILVNIENIDDNGYFKWYLVRYLHPVNYNLKRIIKADNDFAKKLGFKEIKFPLKVKIFTKFKERIPSALVFLVIGETSNTYIKKNMLKKNM